MNIKVAQAADGVAVSFVKDDIVNSALKKRFPRARFDWAKGCWLIKGTTAAKRVAAWIETLPAEIEVAKKVEAEKLAAGRGVIQQRKAEGKPVNSQHLSVRVSEVALFFECEYHESFRLAIRTIGTWDSAQRKWRIPIQYAARAYEIFDEYEPEFRQTAEAIEAVRIAQAAQRAAEQEQARETAEAAQIRCHAKRIAEKRFMLRFRAGRHPSVDAVFRYGEHILVCDRLGERYFAEEEYYSALLPVEFWGRWVQEVHTRAPTQEETDDFLAAEAKERDAAWHRSIRDDRIERIGRDRQEDWRAAMT